MSVMSAIDLPLAHRLGWALVHSVWQVSLVFCLVGLLLSLMRKRSANARYAVAYAGLVLACAVPVVTTVVLNANESSPAPAGMRVPAVAGAGLPAAPTARAADTGISVERLRERIEPLLPGLSFCWLAGVFALAIWNFGGWLQVRRLMRRGVNPAGVVWAARFDEVRRRLGVRRAVRLLESSLAAAPMAAGVLKPVVLLPVSVLTGLTPGQIEAVLAHELMHIRRHDYLANLVQTVLVTLLFYHPAAWWISRLVRRERENCCDDGAISAFGDGIGYARALVALQEMGGASPALAAGSAGSSLFDRIRRIIGKGEPKAYSFAPAVAGILLVVAIGLGAGAQLPVLKPDQALIMGWVENFFMHNYGDITSRKSLEWGDIQRGEDGNVSVVYTYRGTIWDKEKQIFSKTFTFTPKGEFVGVEDVAGFPKKENPPDPATMEGLKALVEDFFSKNYRDITARKTKGWFKPDDQKDGNYSIRYVGVATIWDKEKKDLDLIFTFTPEGEFVSVEEAAKQGGAQEGAEKETPAEVSVLQNSTPEETVAGFTRAAMAGNVALAQSYFLPDGEDYEDIREALENSAKLKALFAAIDPEAPIRMAYSYEIATSTDGEERTPVVWRVKLKREVKLGRETMKPGSEYELDATLKKTENGWYIDNF